MADSAPRSTMLWHLPILSCVTASPLITVRAPRASPWPASSTVSYHSWPESPMMAEPLAYRQSTVDPIDRIKSDAAQVAGRLPPLLIAAERIALTVEQGVHGRRRVGRGESFWQFRQYHPGDELRRLDWRQSAKSDRLYLRQTEWSAAQSVCLWCDQSPSMDFASQRQVTSKLERAQVMLLALSTVLSHAGERVALLGHQEPPMAGRNVAERLADRLLADRDLPDQGDALQPH